MKTEVSNRPNIRKANEVAHGARIAKNALEIWGWGTPAGRRRACRRANLLIELAKIREGMTILELGCGTGVFTKFFAQTGASVVALDLSWELITQIETGSGNIYPQLGDAESLPFEGSSFDAVVGSSILHHLDTKLALSEVFRVLRKGARFAFAEPNMLNPQIAIQKNVPVIKRLLGDSPDETAFIRWKVAALLRGIGFTDVTVLPYDFLHPLVPERYILLVEKVGRYVERVPMVREIAGSLIMSGRK